jgi:hypothetical protein
MSSIGKDAYCGTLHCDTLIANNTTDPHKITGDLEITGDLKVDGGIEVDSAGIKGLVLKSNPSVNQVNISLNENTQTWDISADSQFNLLSFSHTLNGAGSGADVAGLTYDPATAKFGSYFPAGGEFRLQSIPTSATGLTTGTVWSNGGVLNIIP